MLQAIWMPKLVREVSGLSRSFGHFWVGYQDDEARGLIGIDLTVPAEGHGEGHYFASMKVHYDGVDLLSDLFDCDFMDHYQALKASTFYDLMQCFYLSGIPVMVHGDTEHEFVNRKMYELLTTKETH